ncbi:oxidative damage protection protein [Sansalvadorimonas sp. 2012CJ34-2]|uniref:Probable Fe(2+)-trafficking protein n=1 Tax=Parendozoicomonas callyspongiae TaxID=2942213 RepID=A0ABT0PF95_9GAMM|nr:oxidative damage protection protein [Sansalvadorimonas sp. 2012CJ34-2]MCL6269666.1 oxidative damage protection protein [Sansalvadorimonas sp. 2012CJ34-2]
MSRKVNCIKLGREAEGLTIPPMPGPKGQWLFENVSQEAWQMWLQHQTRLINEKHLSLIEPEARKYLAEQMEKFLKGESYDQAEGYVPENK